MHAFTTSGAGYNLHRAGRLGAPSSYRDLAHTAASGGKQSCMPSKQPVSSQGLIVVGRRIQHHFNNAIDVAICRCKRTYVDPKATGKRRADLITVQQLPLDFTGFDYFLGKSAQNSFGTEIEAKAFHPPNQAALMVADRS